MLTLIYFIIVIGILTMVHEFGHFIVAKKSGMQVDEFALGMGPSLVRMQLGDTRYQINAFPVGGYVKIAGMDSDDQDSRTDFNNKPVGRRMAVILAGSTMNILLAAVVFIALGMIWGKNVGVSRHVDRIIPGEPAAVTGLKTGDEIVGIDGLALSGVEQIMTYINERPGREVTLRIRRDQELADIKVVPRAHTETVRDGDKLVEKEVGRIGIVFRPITEPMSFLESLREGVIQTYQLTAGILMSLLMLITGRVPVSAVSGPVGIARVVGDAARMGMRSVLFWLGALSANVGIFNMLPLPALDGGRFTFLLLEVVRGGRKLDPRKESLVHMVGLVLLLLLIAVITLKELFL